MKLLLIVGCLGLAACVSNAPKPQAPANKEYDCLSIYYVILESATDQSIDPDHSFSYLQRKESVSLLDSHYRETGTYNKFLNFCVNRMSSTQRKCALESHSTSEIDLCNKFYPHQ